MKISKKQAQAFGIPVSKIAKARKPDGKTGSGKMFDAVCKAHGLPVPVHQYPFGKEAPPHPRTGKPRKWRFDYLFEGWLAVERVGGVWSGGHHSGGQDQIDDMERRNEAQILGYTVLEFTPEQFDVTLEAFAVIKRALAAFEEQP